MVSGTRRIIDMFLGMRWETESVVGDVFEDCRQPCTFLWSIQINVMISISPEPLMRPSCPRALSEPRYHSGPSFHAGSNAGVVSVLLEPRQLTLTLNQKSEPCFQVSEDILTWRLITLTFMLALTLFIFLDYVPFR